MTEKICDHTSVGVLTFSGEKLFLIDRRLGEQGLAAPAGHVDGHGDINDSLPMRYEQAARAELEEETGLTASKMTLIHEGRRENPCRRRGGDWHRWRVYQAEATGDINLSDRETRGHLWCSREQMESLLRGETIVTEEGRAAGLEPVWQDLFTEISILGLSWSPE